MNGWRPDGSIERVSAQTGEILEWVGLGEMGAAGQAVLLWHAATAAVSAGHHVAHPAGRLGAGGVAGRRRRAGGQPHQAGHARPAGAAGRTWHGPGHRLGRPCLRDERRQGAARRRCRGRADLGPMKGNLYRSRHLRRRRDGAARASGAGTLARRTRSASLAGMPHPARCQLRRAAGRDPQNAGPQPGREDRAVQGPDRKHAGKFRRGAGR